MLFLFVPVIPIFIELSSLKKISISVKTVEYFFKFLNFFFVKRIQDVGSYTNATDVPYRFVPCMISGLTFYLSQKYNPQRAQEFKLYYEDELQRALTEDGSSSSTYITPQAYYPNV